MGSHCPRPVRATDHPDGRRTGGLDLLLEASLVAPADSDSVRTVRTRNVDIGRAPVTLAFTGVPEGSYDLVMRLTIDGQIGLATRVANLRVIDGGPPGGC